MKEYIVLKSGAHLPVIGFGTSQLKGDVCVSAVQDAISVGYRHIDTADLYGNHVAVGEGIRQSGIERSEIFLTSKVSRDHLTADALTVSVSRFLEELKMPYLDLLLIHWPNRSVPIAETLAAMDALRRDGIIRAFGVSNFTEAHLEEARAASADVVANQIELHPTFNQRELRTYCAAHDIAVIAYAPLGRGADLSLPVMSEIAEKYGVSTAQVSLNWLMTHGVAVIPRSSNRVHMEDCLHALQWQMEDEDMAHIDAIEQGERIFNPSFNEFDR